MAQIIQRTWKSGPRTVKRSAWGYTLQLHGRQERTFNAAWTKEDAQNAFAARVLDRDVPPAPAPSTVTLDAFTKI
jgi:hypothetical protein